MFRRMTTILALGAPVSVPLAASAQDFGTDNAWITHLTLYGWLPSISGSQVRA